MVRGRVRPKPTLATNIPLDSTCRQFRFRPDPFLTLTLTSGPETQITSRRNATTHISASCPRRGGPARRDRYAPRHDPDAGVHAGRAAGLGQSADDAPTT